MKLFSFLLSTRRKRSSSRGGHGGHGLKAALRVEALEDRCLPCSISGFAFLDANNNGIFDSGESPLANSTIQLRNAANIVIGTAVTDANGFYRFSTDSNISTAPAALTRTTALASTPTDFTRTLTVQQFDPSLGTLLSVDILNAGAFVSQIKVESLDNGSSTITATDSGSLTLSGPGVAALVTNNSTSRTFNASAFDGIIDFGGTSGHDFGSQTANGSNSFTVTSAGDLASYIGSGAVSFTEVAHATSAASGAGNLITQINTNAFANVSVVYHYIPSNALRPGNYTIVQTSQPPGLLEGLQSSNGAVIPGSVGTDVIAVTLTTSNSTNNDFAEINPASLSGYVYYDANNNGVKEPGEAGIAGVTVSLNGTNDLGTVHLTTQTAGDGSYQFANLRPGAYTLPETQPANYLDGKDMLGSLGGTLGNDQFGAIALVPGVSGVNYNFGEILGASVAGFVYVDANNNGIRDPGEAPIPNTTITLNGTNDLGNTVTQTTQTAADGSYTFNSLRPGVYGVTETQPSGFLEGKSSVGSLGGTLGNDQIFNISVSVNASGVNYNFGEIQPTHQIFTSVFTCPNFSFGHPTFQILSKLDFLASTGSGTSDPVIKAQATYVDGLYRAILARPADANGLVAWVMQLHNGLPPTQIVQALWNSPEHRGLEVDNLYASFLHRVADPGGRAGWINALINGESETDVAAQLLSSGEYLAGHRTNADFVAGLYGDVLARNASSAEIDGWVQALQNGLSRTDAARAFLTSTEFYTQVIECDYRSYLFRAPDAAGKQAWLTMLVSGQVTPQAMTQNILVSQEFLALANQASLS